jgi:hypothetical protein
MKAFILKNFAGSAVRLAVLTALLLGMASACQAQASAAPAQPAAKAVDAAPTAVAPDMKAAAETGTPATPAPPSRPGDEGIKIHGHWKIDVKNPDGTLVKTVEFENSLVTPGSADTVLGQMFTGAFVLAGWVIQAEDLDGSGNEIQAALCPGQGYYGTYAACEIEKQTYAQSGTYGNIVDENECYLVTCFTGLTDTYVPYNSTTKAAAYFQLQGTFSPFAAGNITTVATVALGCAQISGTSAYTPAQCYSSSANNYGAPNYNGSPVGTNIIGPTFTQATLPTPISVIAGQVVTITVTISFS